MKRLLLSILFILSLAFHAEAVDIFVDKDNACPGDGTTGDPYCTIQACADVAVAGDSCLIRDAASAYDETVSPVNSGTASLPITFEPDAGHNPSISRVAAGSSSGAFDITNKNYIHILNFNFVGTGLATPKVAIRIRSTSSTTPTTGHLVSGNTITGWGDGDSDDDTAEAAMIELRGIWPNGAITNSTVTLNTIASSRTRGIRVVAGSNISGTPDSEIKITKNTITGMKCGRLTFSGGRQVYGIFVDSEGNAPIVSENIIKDFQDPADCDITGASSTQVLTNGFKCDAGPANGVLEKNHISNLLAAPSGQGATTGAFLESRCNDWVVKNNKVNGIGFIGLQNGSSGLQANRTSWVNNTVVNVGSAGSPAVAMLLSDGQGVKIQNNFLCIEDAEASILVKDDAVTDGGHTINNNVYCDEASNTKVGKWNHTGSQGSGTPLDLAAWRTACNCDGNSFAATPPFTSASDLTLTASTYDNAGVPASGVGCNASNCAIGAYEPPIVPSGNCVVGIVSALQLICTPENNRYPGLLATDFTDGWSVKKDDVDNPVTSVTQSGGVLTINLTNAFTAGTSCKVTYNAATGSLTDDAPSAFVNKQKMLSFTDTTCSVQVGTGGTASFVAAGTAGTSSTNTSPAPGMPAGVTDGDAIYAALAGRDTNFTAAISAGWTAVVTPTQDTGRMLGLWRCFYPTCSAAPSWTIGSNSGEIVAQLAAFRGINQTTPEGEVTTPSLNVSGNDIGPITGLDLAADNIVVVVGMKRRAWTSVTALVGFTEIGEPDHDAGVGTVGLVWDYLIDSGSGQTIASQTFDVVGGTDDTGKGFMVELNVETTPPAVSRPDGASGLLTGCCK